MRRAATLLVVDLAVVRWHIGCSFVSMNTDVNTDDLRIDVDAARADSATGKALTICAYDDEEKCRSMRLKGALTMGEFRKRKASVDKRDQIILYCA